MLSEHELDPVTKERTGRTRRSQWVTQTIRRNAVPPSKRGDAPFTAPLTSSPTAEGSNG